MLGCLGLFWVLIRLCLQGGDAGPKSMWALIRLGIQGGDAGPKSMGPTMRPFFRLGSSTFPGWKNIVFFTWLSSGTGGH